MSQDLSTAIVEAVAGEIVRDVGYHLNEDEVGIRLLEVKPEFINGEVEPVEGQIAILGDSCRLKTVFSWKQGRLKPLE